jgi:hypothetical protein
MRSSDSRDSAQSIIAGVEPYSVGSSDTSWV